MTILGRPPACLFHLPLRGSDLQNRTRDLRAAIRCLSSGLRSARAILGSWQVHFDINDVAETARLSPNSLMNSVSALCRSVDLAPVTSSVSASKGKIPAINRGLALARERGCDVFVCIDNDIEFSAASIRELLESYVEKDGPGVTCLKMPLVTAQSSKFQRVHSFFFEALFTLGIGPRRSTGSLYALDPWKVPLFPDNSNEADYMDCLGLHQSKVIVRSPLSPDFKTEVQRRARLWTDAAAIGYRRFNDDEEFMVTMLRDATQQHSALRSDDFRESARMYFAVLRALHGRVSNYNVRRGVTR